MQTLIKIILADCIIHARVAGPHLGLLAGSSVKKPDHNLCLDGNIRGDRS